MFQSYLKPLFLFALLYSLMSTPLVAQDAFITKWEITSADEQLVISTGGGSAISDYQCTVDWGDGTSDDYSGDDPDPSHTYSQADTVTISITGTFPHLYLNDGSHAAKLLSVEQWGTGSWESMRYAFYGAEQMVINATDQPDLSGVTDMQGMFRDAKSLNSDLSAWDVSTVQNMSELFQKATDFNGDISSWNVASVTNMESMFAFAYDFNQPINSWDVSSVTDMSGMFIVNLSFNQPLNSWDVSSVTDMSTMFTDATDFNQPLNSWNVSSVQDMNYMFAGATSFNQSLNSWQVGSVTSMEKMFKGADSFKGDISTWDVSAVTDMNQMFRENATFNQDISGWDVSAVTSMYAMFYQAQSFNQPIGNWNVSSVDDMAYMFEGADSFDQDLGSWDVSSVTDFTRFLQDAQLSTQNYSNLLIGWEQLDLQDGIDFNGGASTYNTDGETARQAIMDDDGWTFSDGGLSEASDIRDDLEKPLQFSLKANYPNPFNPSTQIVYQLPKSAQVSLRVYNLLGREVADLVDKRQNAGTYEVTFEASALPSGMYIYYLKADEYRDYRTMMLLK